MSGSANKTASGNPRKTRGYFDRNTDRVWFEKYVAGVEGFEPSISCTKNSCPTARPHPNSEALISGRRCRTQDPFCLKFLFFVCMCA